MRLEEFLQHWRRKYPLVESLPDDLSPRFYSGRGTNYLPVRCPYCVKNGKGEDKSHHCYTHYDDGDGWFKCQRCGQGGSLPYLLGLGGWQKQKEEKSAWESYTSTPETRKLDKGISAKSKGLEETSIKPGITVPLDSLPRTHVAWKYLLSEGFKEKEILSIAEEYGIYYCVHGHHSFKDNPLNTTTNRLIFEIREGNTTYGWQARWLPSNWPANEEDIANEKKIEKYLISPGLKKTYILYNWDLAQEWDMWILVEGVKKVWRTGKFALAPFGISNSVNPPRETSEKAYNQFWSVRLQNGKRPVGILYDKDGFSSALSQVKILREMGIDAKTIPLPELGNKDLDKYHPQEIKQIIKNHMGRLPRKIKSK